MIIDNHSEKKTKGQILNILVFLYVLSVFTFNGIPALSKMDFFVSILIAFILLVKFHINGYIYIPKFIWLPWLFFLFAASSVIWAYHPNQSLTNVTAFFTVLLSANILWIALENGASFQAVIFSIILSSVIIVFSTIYQIILNAEEVTRYAGILNNPNLLAILLSIIGVIIIGQYTYKKIAVLYGFSIIIFATIYSGSRKIVFTWLILCFLLLLNSKIKIKRMTIVYVCFALVFLFFVCLYFWSPLSIFFENLSVVKRFGEFLSGTDQSSADVRSSMIKEGLRFWQNHFWIGNGIGQFSELSIYKKYAHNNYIETLSGLGIIGFLLYYSVYFYILLKSCKQVLQKNKAAVTSLSLIILFLLWEVALVSYIEQFTWLAMVIIFFFITNRKDVLTIRKFSWGEGK